MPDKCKCSPSSDKRVVSDDDLLVVIPSFNEAEYIGVVVSEVRKMGYKVLVVDDGSEDEASAEARKKS